MNWILCVYWICEVENSNVLFHRFAIFSGGNKIEHEKQAERVRNGTHILTIHWVKVQLISMGCIIKYSGLCLHNGRSVVLCIWSHTLSHTPTRILLVCAAEWMKSNSLLSICEIYLRGQRFQLLKDFANGESTIHWIATPIDGGRALQKCIQIGDKLTSRTEK